MLVTGNCNLITCGSAGWFRSSAIRVCPLIPGVPVLLWSFYYHEMIAPYCSIFNCSFIFFFIHWSSALILQKPSLIGSYLVSITFLVFTSFLHIKSLPVEPWMCSGSGRSPHPAVVSISRLWLLLRGNVRLHRLISILMWHSPEDLTVLSRIKDSTYIARNDLSSNITPQRKCSWFKCLPKLLKTKNFWLNNERQFWDHCSFCLEISQSYEWFLGCLNSDNRWCEKSKS